MINKCINEFVSVHGNIYDYSEVNYINNTTKVSIICKDHGRFLLTPKQHKNGVQCTICVNIKEHGNIAVSRSNLRSHPRILKEYLHTKYPIFNFDELIIDNGFKFMCNIHGVIHSKKIKCTSCCADARSAKKITVIKNLLIQRQETPVSIKHNEIILECEHGRYTYNNKQLNGNIQQCKECHPNKSNGLSQPDFITRVLQRIGKTTFKKLSVSSTTYSGATIKIPLICKIHGPFSMLSSNLLKGQGCRKCATTVSKAETEVASFISSTGENVKTSDRSIIKPLEIDIVLPDKKVGIEYNGLMFHSVGKHNSTKFDNATDEYNIKKKHLIKTNGMESKGYQLFHIFENEWIDPIKQRIWKSVISNTLGSNDRLYARRCRIVQVSPRDADAFLKVNHLQGDCQSSIRFGLMYGTELVSLMTFGKARFSKDCEYELIRFCTKLDTVVVGAASRLLKKFVSLHNPRSLVSYANRRWSTGALYQTLGFDFSHISPPNYFYFKPNENILYSRNMFQKHKLKTKLSFFDSTLSESANMYNNGYRKIYDSGNKIYRKYYY